MKKNTKFYISILIATFIVIVALFIYVNKQNTLTQKISISSNLNTIDLSKFTTKKETLKSFDQFIEKAIQFEGTLEDITKNEEIVTLILRSSKHNMNLVCAMQKDQNHKLSKLKKGDTIKMKGIYKGFLNELIFLNCVLI